MKSSGALKSCGLVILAFLNSAAMAQQSGADAPPEMLAAQIRLQGFACDQALAASRDARRSRPDYAVWVLKCSNATYRVSRAPDMSAKVERLRR